MMNVQIIDGAENCTYDVFSVSDEDFKLIFPNGQNVEFAEDLGERLGSRIAISVLKRMWKQRQHKAMIAGIHGTLFFELQKKKKFYPTRKEEEMVASPRL